MRISSVVTPYFLDKKNKTTDQNVKISGAFAAVTQYLSLHSITKKNGSWQTFPLQSLYVTNQITG